MNLNNSMKNKQLQLGFIMDEPEHLQVEGDSSCRLIAESLVRGHAVHYIKAADVFVEAGTAKAYSHTPLLNLQTAALTLENRKKIALQDLDVIIIRKDPPFNMDYIYLTYILEMVEDKVLCINRPSSIRTINEKFYAQNFAHFTPKTLITKNIEDIKEFLGQHPQGIVLKPLDLKGGSGIFKVVSDDPNKNELIKTATANGNHYTVAQEYLPGIKTKGDKRITILNGEPLNAILRIPREDDFKGNICAGATAEKTNISPQEQKICSELRSFCLDNGLYLVGLDLIDEKITEINVTSPIIGFSLYPENQIKILDFIEDKACR